MLNKANSNGGEDMATSRAISLDGSVVLVDVEAALSSPWSSEVEWRSRQITGGFQSGTVGTVQAVMTAIDADFEFSESYSAQGGTIRVGAARVSNPQIRERGEDLVDHQWAAVWEGETYSLQRYLLAPRDVYPDLLRDFGYFSISEAADGIRLDSSRPGIRLVNPNVTVEVADLGVLEIWRRQDATGVPPSGSGRRNRRGAEIFRGSFGEEHPDGYFVAVSASAVTTIVPNDHQPLGSGQRMDALDSLLVTWEERSP